MPKPTPAQRRVLVVMACSEVKLVCLRSSMRWYLSNLRGETVHPTVAGNLRRRGWVRSVRRSSSYVEHVITPAGRAALEETNA